MARYIDADKLKEKLKELRRPVYSDFGEGMLVGNEKAQAALEMMPTADVVEVVRCEDCLECKFDLPKRENGKSALDGWYCKLNREYVNPEAFCSYGKRKDVSKMEITTEGKG